MTSNIYASLDDKLKTKVKENKKIFEEVINKLVEHYRKNPFLEKEKRVFSKELNCEVILINEDFVEKFKCVSCGNKFIEKPKKCDCGGRNIKEIPKEYSKEETIKALKKFEEENLIYNIRDEISKDHLEDNHLKITCSLACISGLLKNPKRRVSLGIIGNTAVGKNNLIEANLKHLPEESYIYISNATQSTIEDDIKEKRIIAFKEINFNRENGANKNLLEVLKQVVEGGTASLKKDSRTNFKESRFEESEQKSVIYPTTESEKDEEGETRYIFGNVKSSFSKIKRVNENTLDIFSEENNLLKQIDKSASWIKIGLTHFFNKNEQYEVVIPYAKYLKEKIEGEHIFDYSDARSQRDIKRLLSLTCAMTYLYQEQRQKKEVNGTLFLVSEPIDLIRTLEFTNEFFNQTYKGVDLRIDDALKFIESKGAGIWVDKLDIQEHLKIKHRETINKYLWELEQKGFIERSKGVQLNERFGLKTYKGNHIYYTSVQKAFNKCLISVQLKKLKEFLESKCSKISVQFDKNIGKTKENKLKQGVGEHILDKKCISRGGNEHLKLNAFSEKEQKIIQEQNLSDEQIQTLIKARKENSKNDN